MIDLADSSLKESRPETRTRSAGSLFQRTMDMGKMSIYLSANGIGVKMKQFIPPENLYDNCIFCI